ATIEHGALATDEDIALMKERGVWLICTFSIFLHPHGIEQGDGKNPAIMEKMRWARRVVDENFPRHLATGVRFALGTDAVHGQMPFEMATLVRLGVTPSDALLAATRWGAEACRVHDQVGSLEVGKRVNMAPGYAQLYSSLQVYQNVFNKLVYVDDAGTFIPGLAKAWKQENDKTWLFDLVTTAVFHNGEAMTSKDVVYTFNRLLDP